MGISRKSLHLANAGGRGADCLKGVGQGEEIVGVAAVDASPAEVGRRAMVFLVRFANSFKAFQVFAVERLGGAKVHGDAVLDDAILFQNLVEYL